MYSDPVTPVLLALALILAAAKLGGHLAARAGQPAVLGELLAGIALGNLHLLGVSMPEFTWQGGAIDAFARVGVIILLFEVGLESTVREMLHVGRAALLVAVLGVVTPFALGWLVGAWLLPGESAYAHAFLGAILTATSVGITARVLKDLGHSRSAEARVILGAAVIDDVLGLLILAVMSGAIGAAGSGGTLSPAAILLVAGKAALFLVGGLSLGIALAPHLFRATARLRGRGVLLTTALVFCFLLAWLASLVGLAPIVGAYAAGLIVEDAHVRDFTERGERGPREQLEPIASLLVPVFFVVMGARVDLASLARPGILGLTAALTAAAILGKQACALGAGGRLDRLSIGLGMMPRGEVGLIFASVGVGLTLGGRPVVSAGVFAAVILVVLLTTLLTPPALAWSFARRPPPPAPAPAPAPAP